MAKSVLTSFSNHRTRILIIQKCSVQSPNLHLGPFQLIARNGCRSWWTSWRLLLSLLLLLRRLLMLLLLLKLLVQLMLLECVQLLLLVGSVYLVLLRCWVCLQRRLLLLSQRSLV